MRICNMCGDRTQKVCRRCLACYMFQDQLDDAIKDEELRNEAYGTKWTLDERCLSRLRTLGVMVQESLLHETGWCVDFLIKKRYEPGFDIHRNEYFRQGFHISILGARRK